LRPDRIAAIVFIAFGAVMAGGSYHLPYMSDSNPGPGLFPLWLSVILIVLSLVMLVTTRVRDAPLTKSGGDFGKVSLVTLSLFVFAAVLDFLGLFIALLLLLAFLVKVVEDKGWKLSIGMSATCCTVCYLLFEVCLRVPVPHGILGI